jgi:xanthine dehydrogenase molybdopterin-binding subunit B
MDAVREAASGIGQPVRRKEDFRPLAGSGRYGDDFVLPGMVHAAFVRSPHAHARLRAIDKAAALFANREPREKRRLLNIVLSNSVWKEGEPTSTFR